MIYLELETGHQKILLCNVFSFRRCLVPRWSTLYPTSHIRGARLHKREPLTESTSCSSPFWLGSYVSLPPPYILGRSSVQPLTLLEKVFPTFLDTYGL